MKSKTAFTRTTLLGARLYDGLLPQYVESYWNSPIGASEVSKVASSTSGLYTLSVRKVSCLSVPLAPLAEQHRIVAEVKRRLSVIQQTEDAVEANLIRAERLRQSILKQAFSGKLVPQDFDDEPGVGSAGTHLCRTRSGPGYCQAQSEAASSHQQVEEASAHSKGGDPMITSTTIGQKLWNYCDVLRDAGLSYGDYLEQLTFLLFLKMMHERSQPPFTLLPDYQSPPIPDGYDWPSLLAREGIELEIHYRRTLEELGRQPGTLGVIFNRARNEIQEPAMLTRLVKDLIDSETWLGLSADVKGDAYESLLERNAQDVKTGAGQYFTPRPLIQAIVDVMRPAPETTICDPACGTGGFLLATHDYIVRNNPSMNQSQLEHLQNRALFGWDNVAKRLPGSAS